MSIVVKEIRQDEFVLSWSSVEVAALFKADAVRQMAEKGCVYDPDDITFLHHVQRFAIEQETEGSPSYNVSRWNARMTIVMPAEKD